MRVFVTGGTGFVGPAVVRAILDEGHEATALVHRSAGSLEDDPRVALVRGDVTRRGSFADAVRGHDAFVHMVAIRRGSAQDFERMHSGATREAVEAARAAGVRRFVYMSAHGVKPDGTPYQRTKWESEQTVKSSGMEWTIFRPTFVTGPAEPGSPGFDQEFASVILKAPAAPSFAGGGWPIQPIAKRDVALAVARSLASPKSAGKAYLLAGPDRLTWNEYLRTLLDVLGKRRPLAPVPRWFILPVAGALQRFRWFPASRDELVALMEGHAGDPSEAVQDLGLSLTPFREALREALAAPWGMEGKRR